LRADLHLHTTASDGRLEPQEIVSLAVKVGLDVIAITDHDSIGGIIPALAAARAYDSLIVIPGVELSTDVPRGEVHLLGYFIDYTDTNLSSTLDMLQDSRQGRAFRMIAKLRDLGMEIQKQRVLELAQGGSVGRPHIAQALLEAGYVASLTEAFDKYIGRNGPAYAEREKMTPVESVKLIASVRGLPVLAHPANIEDLDKLIPELVKAGMVGIEVYYAKYTPEVISRLLRIAEHYQLITTGGTDYHHFEDGIETMIGEVPVPSHSVKKLISLADKKNLKLASNHLTKLNS
jgi:predicted metal-dependent phosphoesterase TrpH